MAGGVCKYISLRLNDKTGRWDLDMNELERSINSRTKLLILNTPHNPTGKGDLCLFSSVIIN